MDCKRFLNLVPEIIELDIDDPTIDAQTLDEFDEHRETCEDCQKAYEFALMIDDALRERAEEIFCGKIPDHLTTMAVDVLKNKASVYEKKGNYEEAIKCLGEALQLSPDNLESLYKLTVTHILAGQIKEAEDVLTKLDELDVNSHERYNLWGVLYFKKGDIDKANFIFRDASLINPQAAYIYNNIALACVEKEDADLAYYFSNLALSFDPKNDLIKENCIIIEDWKNLVPSERSTEELEIVQEKIRNDLMIFPYEASPPYKLSELYLH